MTRPTRSFLAVLLLCLPLLAFHTPPAQAADAPVAATVTSTLATASGQIRQFAFDGDPDTYFLSEKDAGADDHFTLYFDKPVAVKSLTVTTGRPKGGDALDAGTLEVSADGTKFEELAKFADGVARAKPDGRQVQMIRLRPAKDLGHPLAVREIVLESEPAATVFRYPVEFVVDASEARELRDWADKAAHICERQYPMICEELKSDGFKPRTVVTMTLKKDYDGVAATGGGHITGSASYFKSHPDDFGAMVHETVHVVQAYREVRNPGWLVEGIADYVRFFKYEPGKLAKLKPERAKYNGSYRVTAAFLAFVSDKYDQELVRKVNARMREGKYKEEVFKELTGKTVKELEDEWKASLRP
jgi:Peptidase of plants and bacteria